MLIQFTTLQILASIEARSNSPSAYACAESTVRSIATAGTSSLIDS